MQISLILGIVLGIFSSIWILIGDQLPYYATFQIYLVAGLIGMAGTAFLIPSVSLSSDLVGNNNIATNAFVFSAMVSELLYSIDLQTISNHWRYLSKR